MVVYRRIQFPTMVVIGCGILAGCGDGGPEAPSPWTYPVGPTPSPLAPFWSEAPSGFDGYRFAFATDEALSPADIDESTDIYIYDAETGGLSFFEPEPLLDDDWFFVSDPVVSDDGRYVAWIAGLAGWGNRDPETSVQVYVRDLETGATTKASVSSEGASGEGISHSVSISADGKFVTYLSYAANLVPNDLNGGAYAGDQDVFIHDLLTRETERIDILPDGEIASSVEFANLSGDGGTVVFGAWDVYARDLETKETIAIGPEGELNEVGLEMAQSPALSSDGSVIAYSVHQNELVEEGSEETVERSYYWIFNTDSTGSWSQVVLGPFDGTSREFYLRADGRSMAYAVRPLGSGGNEFTGPMTLLVSDLPFGETQEVPLMGEWVDQEETLVRLRGFSADGRFVVYDVWLSRTLEGNLYIHDLVTGDTTLLH